MSRTPRIPLLFLSLVTACYSPNNEVVVDDDGAGPSDDSAGSTGTGGMTDAMTGPTTDPTADTGMTEPSSAGPSSDTEDTTTGDPICGNGELEGDEVCDDGVNDGSYGGCNVDCAAFGPRCGDDAIQGSEDCDDGDGENGDGCNIDCTISGELVWTRTFDGSSANGVAVDGSDNAVVATFDGEARFYDTDGAPGWITQIAGIPVTNPHAEAVAFDGVGWLVGGIGSTALQGINCWWRKLDDDGVLGSSGVYDGPEHVNDSFGHLAFDLDGNFYLSGTTDDPDASNDSDVWLRKYDTDGSQLWARTFDGGNDDSAHGVATASDGGVVIAGSTEVSGQSYNTWLRKYDAEGSEDWTRTSTSEGSTSDTNFAVAVGPDGSVASVGGEGDDIFVRLHSPGGVEIWTQTYDGPAADSGFLTDSAVAVAVDSAGAVVAGGFQLVGATDIDAWVRKYNADGDAMWTVSPEASAATTQFANGIAIDSHDYVLVAGGSSPDEGWLVKYTP